MAGKPKFQILRTLDERIKNISNNCDEYEPEFKQIADAYILGSHCGNTTNYNALTTDYQLYNAASLVVGLVFFKSDPSSEDIVRRLEQVRDFFSSAAGLGCNFEKSDQNENLYLIYYLNTESNTVDKKIYDLTNKLFLENQPKLSVLDESKIYNHSALVRINLSIKLDLCERGASILGDESKINTSIDELKNSFSSDGAKSLKMYLDAGNYSTDFSQQQADESRVSESLYDYLDVPKDVEQMGDYLPQMSKDEKSKIVDKWKNKVKSQRAPLEFKLEHEELSFNYEDESMKKQLLSDGFYGLKLVFFHYLQVNDSIYKTKKLILYMIRHHLDLLKIVLMKKTKQSIEIDELRSCSFKSSQTNHIISAIYPLPTNHSQTNYDSLKELRKNLHLAYLVPLNQPQFRFSQRILNLQLLNSDQKSGFLCNVHESIKEQSGIKNGRRDMVEGTYTYHHYLQDNYQDNGWGCAYRSLQTIISWFKHQGYIYSPDVEIRALKDASDNKINNLRLQLHKEKRVPTHEEIQSVLVDVGDKPDSFVGSKKWIGSQEVNYVLQHLYNIDCKFISVSSGSELTYKARDLGLHFATQSTPIMIGGGVLAHTIIGLDFNDKNGDVSYLILDPHYTGSEDLSTIQKKGWCGWKKNTFWDKNAFYNLCLPQKPNNEF